MSEHPPKRANTLYDWRRIVTKSSNLAEKSQKNLLSLYLTEEGILNKQLLSETLKDVKFTDEKVNEKRYNHFNEHS